MVRANDVSGALISENSMIVQKRIADILAGQSVGSRIWPMAFEREALAGHITACPELSHKTRPVDGELRIYESFGGIVALDIDCVLVFDERS